MKIWQRPIRIIIVKYTYILVIAVFTFDHQVKKVLELVKQNIFSRFDTRINIIT